MKREVTVCDSDRCRSLADRVCPLCEKDFCAEHFKPELHAELAVRRMGTPQPGQAPFAPGQERFETHNVGVVRIGICSGCYVDLERAQSGGAPRYERRSALAPLAEGLEAPIVETCRAALAAYKLEQSAKAT